MAIRLGVTAALLALTALVLTAHMVFAGPDQSGSQPTAQRPETVGLRLTASTDHATVDPGDLIEITLTLENVGKDTVRVPGSGAILSIFEFDVLLPTGKLAPPTLYGKKQSDVAAVGSFSVSPLEPGAKTETMVPLSRLYDMTLEGKYQITVRRRISADLIVTSKTLTVTVGEVRRTTTPAGARP
jgi:hypothetical protein